MPYDGCYHQNERDDAAGMGCAAAICGLLATIALLVAACSANINDRAANSYTRHDALTQTWTNQPDTPISVYVVADPDTGIEYLVTSNGGICPRVQTD